MTKEKIEDIKENPQGIFILFQMTGGKLTSKMSVNKATVSDISSAFLWCEITKENLLNEFKKIATIEKSDN